MAKAQAEAPGTSGSQFFVVTAPDCGPAARVRRRRQGHGRDGDGRSDRGARRRRRAALDAGRDGARHGSRVLIGAVVLAAGAATRFGAPKQRLLLPAVLDRLGGVDQVVVVSGAYELEGAVPCPDWERGPGASLRCGLAALGPEVEAAVVVLADGPELAPGRGRARRRGLARDRRADRRRELRRRPRPPPGRRPVGLGRHP